MSLINKMLQELDARGTPPADAFPSNVKPVAPERRAPSLSLAGMPLGATLGGLAALAAAAALGWFGWQHWHAVRPAVAPHAVVAAKPAAPLPQAGMAGSMVPAPAAATGPVAQIAPAGAVESQAIGPETATAASAAASAQARTHAREADPLFGSERPARAAVVSDMQGKSVAPTVPDSPEARDARQAAAIELATRDARMARLARLSAPAAPPAKAVHAGAENRGRGVTPAEGREESALQRAENEYRCALVNLQDGHMGDAIAGLQTALRIDPGHEAARQTLVGLLVEANRVDDAIGELQLGLARDPRQPAMAMLLARLQIESGGSGIDALTRTLPYVGSGSPESAEYHGFLAGALQRQGRQREAVEQYQQALRAAPGNGVWWMGLGISLQADKRNGEALDAFQHARASGSLNAELQAFVERRIGQLDR